MAGSARDEKHTTTILREDGLCVDFCRTIEDLAYEVEAGAAVVLLNDTALRRENIRSFIDAIQRQPAWSNIPLVVVCADERSGWLNKHGITNATVLRQPVYVETLLSVVRSAIASRRKQYEVRDLLSEQSRTQNELRLADRRKNEFLATLAHELRNPISPIKNALDLLDIADAAMEDERELRQIMQRQVNQLARIVDDLLDVSRITRGRIKLDRKVFDLREAMTAAVESSSPFIERSEQTLTVDVPENPIYVDGDSSRLAQCIANLLNNAAKYTPKGGSIGLQVCRSSGMVELSVRDNGIGIASEHIESVFELFRQHDIDQERGQAGLGIGLSLVRRLLDLHAGTIEVHSDGVGQGSVFKIRLPAAMPPSSGLTSATGDSARNTSGKKYQVLVVEDMRAIRYVLKRLLEAMGHEVVLAEDGVEGLEKAQLLQPDIIMSDISMPRLNGLQLAKRLRTDRAFDHTTLVAMTGYGRSEDRDQAIEAGFNEHLTKPVDVRKIRHLFAAMGDK